MFYADISLGNESEPNFRCVLLCLTYMYDACNGINDHVFGNCVHLKRCQRCRKYEWNQIVDGLLKRQDTLPTFGENIFTVEFTISKLFQFSNDTYTENYF